MPSQSEFDDKLRADYVQEARELLADAEICFVQLERDKGNKDLIDRIFRMIHTVKGSGSIVGFDSFTRFAHQFEGLLAQIRAGTLGVDDAIMNLMFEANDVLKDWLDALQVDYAVEWDTSATVSKLSVYSVGQPPKVRTAPAFGFFEDDPAALTPETSMVTVLLVDDEKDILDLYESYLEGMPIRTLRALDGREAVAILEKDVPDLMIFDLRMPNMNGMELLAHVRKKSPDIPVIFASGYSDRADIISMLNMGAFAFLGKPVTREQFLNEVRNGLRERSTRQDVLKLTQLNFLAFLTLAKITHSRDAVQKRENEAKMKSILDDIVLLQNSILEAKYDLLVD
ncbi:MAG TPA: response regulator [Oligoflexus sp.]|uniref:response regulator n=1 Tax=Oligoflexus sp. TaxID=1971216 RepID=UPI002D807C6C|nr:response regulator [Oligoflexus sp.]HET9237264.1 response regulator [Oligoflexus sp.]